jgi:hypothetical protein
MQLNDAIVVYLITGERMSSGVSSETDRTLRRQVGDLLNKRFSEIMAVYFGGQSQ